MKMYYGPRTLIVNSKPLNKPKEKVMEKLQSFKMPPVIMGIENETEKSVEKWYRNHKQVRSVIQEYAKQHPNGKVAKLARSLDLNSWLETYPAPPCILVSEEEE